MKQNENVVEIPTPQILIPFPNLTVVDKKNQSQKETVFMTAEEVEKHKKETEDLPWFYR